jgi:hypothetical protein
VPESHQAARYDQQLTTTSSSLRPAAHYDQQFHNNERFAMKILITNQRMAKRTGTELYVFELALELLSRGHTPIVFAPQQGALSEQLRSRTVPVVDQLSKIGSVPDVIHGHHFEPLLCAALRFPRTPAVFCCHSWNSELDEPPRLSRIQTYAAVDNTCRDRLIYEFGIPEERTALIHNFVNLERFACRGPLPDKPKKALLFTNRRVVGNFRAAISSACRQHNIDLEFLGAGSGKQCETPEQVLPKYDLVFARGKAAIESLAVGAAVIVCDRKGLGPLVRTENFDHMRDLNFGRRLFTQPMTAANVSAEIAHYSPSDMTVVCGQIRNLSSLQLIVDQWLSLYQQTVEDYQPDTASLEGDLIAASAHLESLGKFIQQGRKYENMSKFIKSFPRRIFSPITRLFGGRRAA